MQDEFLRLQGVLKKTIMFITHDFDEALRLADRIAIMKDGIIEQLDTPAKIVLNPATEYVRKFTEEVPREKVLKIEAVMDPVDDVKDLSDFKVSKVPALAQLLTLASLQGIADTLSGEGIRFESFEMKSNSKDNLLNIEESLALGPAVSIFFDGYVDKGKIVSLSGTLVPARTVNKVIGWIPLVGKILVGNKIGEGVFGVSFKMKGPPKNIKTTVNPIKTLTPRFVTRILEKIKDKKNKNEETK